MVRAARIPPVDSAPPEPLDVDEPGPPPSPEAQKTGKHRDGEELGARFGVGEDADPQADDYTLNPEPNTLSPTP